MGERASDLHSRHETALRRYLAVQNLGALFDMPRGTPVYVDGTGSAHVLAYNPQAGTYTLRQPSQLFMDVRAESVRPTLENEADISAGISELERRHAAEEERIKLVHHANKLVVKIARERLPVGTPVEVDAEAARGAYGSGRYGHIVAQLPAGECTVHLEAGHNTRAISSASRITVSVETVTPVFWTSPRPLHDALLLCVQAN